MTRAEMTEIFALLMLAYPNAEMFKAPDQQALKEKLAPVITLWTACMRDVDFWTAQRAVVRVCQTCKFPPTIAEMREAAGKVMAEVESEIAAAYLSARNAVRLVDEREWTMEQAYKSLSGRSRKVIDTMGGMEQFAPEGSPVLNMGGFQRTYETLLRSNPVGLPGGQQRPKKLN